MMDDPQMKDRMQKHMKMMEMADDSSMMKMHITCMQMMRGDMMNQKGMMNKKSKKGNKHQQHHN